MLIMAEYRQLFEKLMRIKELSKEIKEEIRRMNDIVDSLDIFWDGEANESFMLKLNAGLCNAKLLVSRINKSSYFLSYILKRYQNSERLISEMINGVK